MFDILVIIIALSALLLATVQDLKTREVPDLVSYGLIAAAIALRLMAAVYYQDVSFILYGVYGFVVSLIFSLMMFYTGQWGGGDSKLLMGLGILIGMPLAWRNDLVAFIINIFFMGSIWGVLYTLFLVKKNKTTFFNHLKAELKDYTIIKISLLVLITLFVIFAFITPFTLMFLFLALLLPFTFYLWIATSIIEKKYMIKKYSVDKLTEGDWIKENVFVKGKVLVGPKDLGISKQQIALLKKYGVKHVMVKEGIPFVPSFLLGYIALVLGLSVFSFI